MEASKKENIYDGSKFLSGRMGRKNIFEDSLERKV